MKACVLCVLLACAGCSPLRPDAGAVRAGDRRAAANCVAEQWVKPPPMPRTSRHAAYRVHPPVPSPRPDLSHVSRICQ